MAAKNVVLEEDVDENYEPTDDEIIEYAKWLGLDPVVDRELLWIAREGLKAPLPENWKACKTDPDGDIYYFNFATGESIWDHPLDDYYRELAKEEKKKIALSSTVGGSRKPSIIPKAQGGGAGASKQVTFGSASSQLSSQGQLGPVSQKPPLGQLKPLGSSSNLTPVATSKLPPSGSAPIVQSQSQPSNAPITPHPTLTPTPTPSTTPMAAPKPLLPSISDDSESENEDREVKPVKLVTTSSGKSTIRGQEQSSPSKTPVGTASSRPSDIVTQSAPLAQSPTSSNSQMSAQLESERRKLDEERKRLDQRRVELDEAEKRIAIDKESLQLTRREITSDRTMLDTQRKLLLEDQNTLQRDRQALDESRRALSAEKTQFEAEKRSLDQARAQLDSERQTLTVARQAVTNERSLLETQRRQLEEDRTRLAASSANVTMSTAQQATFDAQRHQFEEEMHRKRLELEDAQRQLDIDRTAFHSQSRALAADRDRYETDLRVLREEQATLQREKRLMEDRMREFEVEKLKITDVQRQIESDRRHVEAKQSALSSETATLEIERQRLEEERSRLNDLRRALQQQQQQINADAEDRARELDRKERDLRERERELMSQSQSIRREEAAAPPKIAISSAPQHESSSHPTKPLSQPSSVQKDVPATPVSMIDEDASLYENVDLRLDETRADAFMPHASSADDAEALAEKERLSQAKQFLRSYKSDLKRRQSALQDQQRAWTDRMSRLRSNKENRGSDSDEEEGVLLHIRKLLEQQVRRFNEDVKQFEASVRWVRLREERLQIVAASAKSDRDASSLFVLSAASPVKESASAPSKTDTDRRLDGIERELHGLAEKMQSFVSAAYAQTGAALPALPFLTSASPPQQKLRSVGRTRKRSATKEYVERESPEEDNRAFRAMAPEWQQYVGAYMHPQLGRVSQKSLHSLRDFQSQLLLWANENAVSEQVLHDHAKWLRNLRKQITTMRSQTVR